MNRHTKRILRSIIPKIILIACLIGLVFLLIREKTENDRGAIDRVQIEDEETVAADEPVREADVEENLTVIEENDFLLKSVIGTDENGNTTVTYQPAEPFESGTVYLLSFKARSDRAAHVTVGFGNEYTYPLSAQWQYYYMPCTTMGFNEIRWKMDTAQPLYIEDVSVQAYGADVDLSSLLNGIYPEKDLKEAVSEDAACFSGNIWDVVTDGRYLFAIGDGCLTVLNADGDVVSSVNGLGNVRHLEIRDGIGAVACRENGLFLVDISDVHSPALLCHYNTLEYCNDVCFAGNYLIAACRFGGVEIIDITNPEAPVFVNRIIYAAECYRCNVRGSVLYISCWNDRELLLYDISDVMAPRFLSSVQVSGACCESFVDGTFLYIATGNKGVTCNDAVGQPGVGTVNAVEVYDISDPEHSQWVSSMNLTGCMRGAGYDDWSIQVSDGIACFTNSYNGMFIFNVSDPTEPVLISNPQVHILPDSDNYHDLKSGSKYVYPFSPEQYIIAPTTGVCFLNNKIVFSCGYGGLYILDWKGVSPVNAPEVSLLHCSENLSEDIPDTVCVLQEYDVYSLCKTEEGYLAGCESELLLLDPALNILYRYPVEEPVMDISSVGNEKYVTAERTRISLYSVTAGSIERLNTLESDVRNVAVSQLAVFGNSYVLVQDSWKTFHIAKITTKNTLSWEKELTDGLAPGLLYNKNLVKGSDDTAGIIGSNRIFWFTVENGDVRVVKEASDVLYNDKNGGVFLSDREMLFIYKSGYVIFDPLNITAEDAVSGIRYTVDDNNLCGKLSVAGDWLVVNYYPKNKILIVNISNPEHPYLVRKVNLLQMPGSAVECDGGILIPMRHGGIVKVICRE